MSRKNRYYLKNNSKRNCKDLKKEAELFIGGLGLENPQSDLICTALTHPSYTFENPDNGLENNQRLEFLGDAVLDFIIAEYLYLAYPEKPEGELTKMRAAVVN